MKDDQFEQETEEEKADEPPDRNRGNLAAGLPLAHASPFRGAGQT
jgi:hypothetical protein